MSLDGKRIILLGGTSGFGLATAKAAAKEGAEIVVVSSRQESVTKALAQLPANARGHAIDLVDEAQIHNFFERIGEFDHLVYTAADPLALNPIDEIELDAARAFFNLRFWSPLAAVKHSYRNIRAGGSITLTSGIVSRRPWKGWVVAAGVAGAIEAMTRALAVELAPLRVNTVCAGLVRTPLWNGMDESERETFFADTARTIPVRRIGEAEDLAQTYLYLMREGFSTGQTIVVDGGAVLV